MPAGEEVPGVAREAVFHNYPSGDDFFRAAGEVSHNVFTARTMDAPRAHPAPDRYNAADAALFEGKF